MITLEVTLMTKANFNAFTSSPCPPSMLTRTGRWKPSVFKPNNCQYTSFNSLVTTFPQSIMSMFFRTLSRLMTSSGPSFQSPLFRPLREMMDKGRALPPSPPVTPTPTYPHQLPLNPSKPAPQGVARRKKVYAPRFNP